MPIGTTIAIVAASAAAVGGLGFLAGRATAPEPGAEVIEANTEQLRALSEGNASLVAEVQAVAAVDAQREADLTAALTGTPPPCVPELGGDPMSLQCAWALCIRTGETDKQRCEPSKLTDALLDGYACREE